MKLKNFDYKRFLLEKGERLGLGIAGGIGLLLIIVGLFLPKHGIFTDSPTVKAADLEKITKEVDGNMKRASPTDADKPPPDAAKNRIDLDVEPVDSSRYAVASLFVPTSPEGSKRRPPEVYAPEEGIAAAVRVPLDLYVITNNEDGEPLITVLEAASSKSTTGDKKPGPASPGPAGRENMGAMAGLSLSQFNLGKGGNTGLGSFGKGIGTGRSPFGAPGAVSTLEPAKGHFVPKPILLKNLDKEGHGQPARQLKPLRMAIITGSFPYRKELESFRAAMRLGTAPEVLSEFVDTTRDGKPVHLPSFRFLGVDLERREFNSVGEAVSDWQPIDLPELYKPWVFAAGKRFEPDPMKLKPVSPPGLVMPRLRQFRAKGDNDAVVDTDKSDKEDFENHYPDLEEQLPKLARTLEDLKGKPPEAASGSLPANFDPSGFNPFDPTAAPTAPDKPGGAADAGPGKARPPAGVAPAPGGNAATSVIPEYCLVRVIDVTIEPGKIYQYRMRVRMGNPNEGRKDVSSPLYAQEPELSPSKWCEVPEKVALPSELVYYAVDQKELGDKDVPYDNTGGRVRLDADSMVLQIHKWIDRTNVAGVKEKDPVAIGEWAVAERAVVHRGEYVDKVEHVMMPVWNYSQNTFVLPADATGKKNNKTTIEVSFSHGLKEGMETILVDFEGGKHTFKVPEDETDLSRVFTDRDGRPQKAIEDLAPMDVLLLTPEGKLIGRNSAADAKDSERTKRREVVRKRIHSVLAKAEGDKKSTPGGLNKPGTGKETKPGGGD
jgi:hypothetical protein